MRTRIAVLGSAALVALAVVVAAALWWRGGPVFAQNAPGTPAASTAYLGVQVADVTPGLKARLGLSVDHGVAVLNVTPDSPAQRGGVQRGDVILAAGSDAVATVSDLTRRVQAARPGETLALRVNRAGSEQPLNVTLADRPTPPGRGQGPLGQVAPGQLAEGSLTFVGQNGVRTTLRLVAGKVTAVSATSLTIEPHGAAGQRRAFAVSADTPVPGARPNLLALRVDDEVVVATKDDPNTAVLVLRGTAFGPLLGGGPRGRGPDGLRRLPLPGFGPGGAAPQRPQPSVQPSQRA